ncbi:Dcp1p-Dcp2p decapping enzyme complex alpha subunit, partial [Quaeritorhiza haematococci]
MLPDVPGEKIDQPQLGKLRSYVAGLLGLNPHKSERFPGAQPISFAKKHFDDLENEDFFVSEKADGIRLLLFTNPNPATKLPESFLIDRKNNYFHLDLWFPQQNDLRKAHFDTVLDGELVLDQEKDGKKTLWFLLFDCIVVDGKSLMDRPYHKRLGHLREMILKPFQQLQAKDPKYSAKHPFRMGLKKLELSYGLERVFEQIELLKHKSDGIIFTSKDAPYSTGTCDKMLKWKPSEENTVDFKIDARGPPDKHTFWLQLWRGGSEHQDFCEFHLDSDMLA